MSIVFDYERQPPIIGVIFKFFDEITNALDESLPYPRRVAYAVKWAFILKAIGCNWKGSLEPAEISPSVLYELVGFLLQCASKKLAALSRMG